MAGPGEASNLQTFFNLISSFLGAGILALPAAFEKVGMAGGIVGMIFIGTLNVYTMQL